MTPSDLEPATFCSTSPPNTPQGRRVHHLYIQRRENLRSHDSVYERLPRCDRWTVLQQTWSFTHTSFKHMQIYWILHIKRSLNKRSYCYYYF